jgi:phytoene/squalene synthetase
MFLKNYQIKVVTVFKQFYQSARETKTSFDAACKALPENMRQALDLANKWYRTFESP